jgi:cell division protein FtsL
MRIKKRQRIKKPFPKIIFKYLAVLFFLAIVFFLISSNFKLYQKRTALGSQIEELTKKIKDLEEKNQEMKAQISRSQSQEYLEEVAFEKLNLKPKGAEVGVIVPIPEEKEEEPQKEKSLWEKILEKLGF